MDAPDVRTLGTSWGERAARRGSVYQSCHREFYGQVSERLGGRQPHADSGAYPVRSGQELDRAVEPRDERPGDRQAEAAAVDALARRGPAIEAVEDTLAFLGRHADSSIDHLEHGPASLAARANPNRPPGIRVLQRVVDQNGAEPSEGVGSALHV